MYLNSDFLGDQSVISMEGAELMERLAVRKPRTQIFDTEIFNLDKLYEEQCKEQYEVKCESNSLCWERE